VHTLDDLANLDAAAGTQGLKPCQIPIINIPTSLSGGEYSQGAGATDTRDHHKVGFTHPSMGAELIILDPALSISTPARIWLSTGMRAVDHCVEGLCSLDHRVTAETDEYAAKGLSMLVPSLLETKRDWEAEGPRLAEMMGVIEAMKSMSTGVPMGETSCIMLPAVLNYSYEHGDEKVRSRQKRVLDVLWGEEMVAKVLTERRLEKGKANAGDVLDAVIRELGMPRTLQEVGVKREQLDALAVNCLKDRWLKTNPVPLTTKEQVLEILEMVIGDEKSSL
jgi:alcohol dehydrogenase class IV